jgi:amino acid transporter
MGESKPGVFAREATGLVREVGFMLGVIVILSHVIGLGWQKRAFQFTGPRPIPTDLLPLGLPAMFWAFVFGGLVVIITGYVVGYVTASMPRSGGGYVTISRVLHPFVGYNAGWLMFLAEAFSYGLIGVAVFEAIGIFYSIALAPTSLAWAFEPVIILVGGIVVVWLFAILALFGVRLYGRLMEAMFIVPAVITVAFFAMWIAGATNPSAVVTGVQDVMGTTPDAIMTMAVNTGMTTNISSFFDAFTYALPGAFWAYMGWYATTFIAGEVKEANKKLPLVVISAGVIIILVYLAASSASAFSVLNVGTRTVGGHQWSFFQAYSWLSYPPGSAADAVSAARAGIENFQPAWSTGIASIIARGLNLGWLSWIIALAGVFWLANDIPPFLLVASRTFFAMSFDRMLPESFAFVSEKWHSPVWAIIATAVAAMFGAVSEATTYLPDIGKYFAFAGVIGTDIFDALFLTLFCVSAMLLPLERKEIYDRAAVKHSVATVVGLGALGTLGAAFCLWAFLKESTFFLFPTDSASLWGGIGFFLCIGIGIVLYIYFMYRNTTRGVDMRTLYISIPPE